MHSWRENANSSGSYFEFQIECCEADRISIQTIGLTLEKNNDFCQSLGWYLKKTSYCMESSFVKCFIHFSKYSPKKVINSYLT